MKNNISEALRLNRINFDHIEGQRFYYHPISSCLSFYFHLFLMVFFIFYSATTSTHKYDLVSLVLIIWYTFSLVGMLHKIIFKNPIFILKGNQLFYTKSEKWYDLSKCKDGNNNPAPKFIVKNYN